MDATYYYGPVRCVNTFSMEISLLFSTQHSVLLWMLPQFLFNTTQMEFTMTPTAIVLI